MANFTATVTANETFPDGTPITRAMLRNAATPEVALSGSVGAGDISAGAVTNTEFSSTAGDALAHTKVALTEHNILVGDSTNLASALAPASIGLLSDNGTQWKNRTTGVSGDIDFTILGSELKFDIKNNAVEGDHLNGNVADGTFLAVLSDRLNIADATDPGVLGYGSGGAPTKLTTTGTGQILVSQGTSAPAFKVHQKLVTVANPIALSQWNSVAHGITVSGGNFPFLICLFYECVTDDLGYVSGDRVYAYHNFDYNSAVLNAYVDSTNVNAYIGTTLPYLPHKSTGTYTIMTAAANWKLMAVVSEI